LDTVELEIQDKVGIITLNRPEARNAINKTVMSEVAQALIELETNADIKVIVITGGPKVFAAGADIAAMVDRTPMEQFHRISLWDLTFKLEKSSKPIISNGTISSNFIMGLDFQVGEVVKANYCCNCGLCFGRWLRAGHGM